MTRSGRFYPHYAGAWAGSIRSRRRPIATTSACAPSASAVASANAAAVPRPRIATLTVKQKSAYAKKPAVIPRSSRTASSGPCCASVKAARTGVITGNAATSPLRCGPSAFAAAVTATTGMIAQAARSARSKGG